LIIALSIPNVEPQARQGLAIQLCNFGHGRAALLDWQFAYGFDGPVNRFKTSIESGAGEIDSELTHQRPCAEAEEHEKEKHRNDTKQAVDKEEAIAETPEQVAVGVTKGTEGHDYAKRE
jgi:hypothetical protein